MTIFVTPAILTLSRCHDDACVCRFPACHQCVACRSFPCPLLLQFVSFSRLAQTLSRPISVSPPSHPPRAVRRLARVLPARPRASAPQQLRFRALLRFLCLCEAWPKPCEIAPSDKTLRQSAKATCDCTCRGHSLRLPAHSA